MNVFTDWTIQAALNTAVAQLYTKGRVSIQAEGLDGLSEYDRIKAVWEVLAYVANIEKCYDHGNLRLVARGVEYLFKEVHLDVKWELWQGAYVFMVQSEPDWPPIRVDFYLDGEEYEAETAGMFVDWLELDSGEKFGREYPQDGEEKDTLPIFTPLRGLMEDIPFMEWAPVLRAIQISLVNYFGMKAVRR